MTKTAATTKTGTFIPFAVTFCYIAWGRHVKSLSNSATTVLIPTSDVAFKQRHRTAEQTTQRWVETETTTEKSADTSTIKY